MLHLYGIKDLFNFAAFFLILLHVICNFLASNVKILMQCSCYHFRLLIYKYASSMNICSALCYSDLYTPYAYGCVLYTLYQKTFIGCSTCIHMQMLGNEQSDDTFSYTHLISLHPLLYKQKNTHWWCYTSYN